MCIRDSPGAPADQRRCGYPPDDAVDLLRRQRPDGLGAKFQTAVALALLALLLVHFMFLLRCSRRSVTVVGFRAGQTHADRGRRGDGDAGDSLLRLLGCQGLDRLGVKLQTVVGAMFIILVHTCPCIVVIGQSVRSNDFMSTRVAWPVESVVRNRRLSSENSPSNTLAFESARVAQRRVSML